MTPSDDNTRKRSITPKIALTVFSILVVFAFGAIFTLTSWSFYPLYDYSYIGSTIGGITAPFLSIAGSLLVYFSFRAQTEANHELTENIRQNQMLKEYDQIYGLITDLIEDYQRLKYKNFKSPNQAIAEFLAKSPQELTDPADVSFLQDFAYVMESADFSSRKIFYFKDKEGDYKRVLRSRFDNFFAIKLSHHLNIIRHKPKFIPYFEMYENALKAEIKSRPVLYARIVQNIRNIRETINERQYKT